MAASPSTTRARRAPTAGTTGTEAAYRADGSAASGLAGARLHRGEPDGWRTPRGSPVIGWEQDVDLDGNPPSVAVLRADRAGKLSVPHLLPYSTAKFAASDSPKGRVPNSAAAR